MNNKTTLLLSSLALLWAVLEAKAQQVVRPCVEIKIAAAGAVQYKCQNVSSTNPLPVSAAVSVGGFAPASVGTPISATTSGVTGTLPAGTTVLVQNVGTFPAYCQLGSSATGITSSKNISASGGQWAIVPGVATQLTCQGVGGTTTINTLGGSGLGVDTGGGSSGGGGGGAITAASGAYAAGALAAGAGVDGWDLTQGAKGDAAWVSGSGSVIAILKTISASATASSTAALQTSGNTSLSTLAGAVSASLFQDNISKWAGTTLGAPSNYGTSPGAVAVPGVNAFVTNTNANGQTTASASSPVVIASDQSAVKVSPQAITTGGSSTTGNIAANNTTAVVIKASAGTLYGVQVYGIGSAPAYLKIYNATSATCGSGTPVKRLMIPAASTAANGAGSNITFGPAGVAFGTGITYCVTTGITDADTTAPVASTFLVNVDYQ